jgi:predicted PurR-regulated permease PerM
MNSFPISLFVLTTFVLQCVLAYLYISQRNKMEQMKSDIKSNNSRIINLVRNISLVNKDHYDSIEQQDKQIRKIGKIQISQPLNSSS